MVPGDQIRFTVEVLQRRRAFWRLKGEGHVSGTLVVEAELTAMLSDEERKEEKA